MNPVGVDGSAATRQVALTCVAMVGAMASWCSTAAAAPSLTTERGVGPATAAAAALVVQVGFAAAALAIAAWGLADQQPPRTLAASGAAAAAACNLVPLAVDAPAALVASRAGVGAALALVYPSLVRAVAAWTVARRAAATCTVVAALTVGTATPHLVVAAGAPSWRAVLVATSTLALAAAVAALALRDGPAVPARSPFRSGAAGALLADRRIRLALTGYLGHMWELYAMWALVPLLAERALGDGAAARVATFVAIAAGGAGCLMGQALAGRVGRPRAAGLALRASGASTAVLVLHGVLPRWVVVATLVVWGVAAMADGPQFTGAIVDAAPSPLVGTAVTLQLAAGYLLAAATVTGALAIERHAGAAVALAALVPGPLAGSAAMHHLARHDGGDGHAASAATSRTVPSTSTRHPIPVRAVTTITPTTRSAP